MVISRNHVSHSKLRQPFPYPKQLSSCLPYLCNYFRHLCSQLPGGRSLRSISIGLSSWRANSTFFKIWRLSSYPTSQPPDQNPHADQSKLLDNLKFNFIPPIKQTGSHHQADLGAILAQPWGIRGFITFKTLNEISQVILKECRISLNNTPTFHRRIFSGIDSQLHAKICPLFCARPDGTILTLVHVGDPYISFRLSDLFTLSIE